MGWSHRRAAGGIVLLVALSWYPSTALAQRPYVNTHVGRPLRVEDATPEHAGEIEIRIPAVRRDDPDIGPSQWRLDSGLSVGVSSRTAFDIGASFVWLDPRIRPHAGLAGLDLGLSHLIAGETTTLPAVAVALDVFVPAGPLRSGGVWTQVRTAATRARGLSRIHMNTAVGQYQVDVFDPGATCTASSLLIKLGLTCDGSAIPVPGGPCAVDGGSSTRLAQAMVPKHCVKVDAAFVLDTTIVIAPVITPRSGVRWFSGLAVDYDLEKWSTLLMADLSVSRLVGLQPAAEWTVELGARHQLAVRSVLDVGIGRRFSGARQAWSVDAGLTWSAR